MQHEYETHWPEFKESTADARVSAEMQVGQPEDARDDPDQSLPVSADLSQQLPKGVVYITNVVGLPTRNPRTTQYTLTLQGNKDWPANQTTVQTINERLADAALVAWHTRAPVELATRRTRYGYDVAAIGDVVVPEGRRSDMTPAQKNCPKHRWDWATPTVMKCRHCDYLWRPER